MKQNVTISIIGCGTVGLGVLDHLNRLGFTADGPLKINPILVKNPDSDRGKLPIEDLQFTSSYDYFFEFPMDILVEVAGGCQAGEAIIRALKQKIPVVSANKSFLACRLKELYSIARENNTSLMCEAAVCGGIPIVKTAILQFSCPSVETNSVKGILNGTTNYILSEMQSALENGEDIDCQKLVEKAQKLGYAESDPTADVAGHDALNKLSILSNILFKTEGKIPVQSEDIRSGPIDIIKEEFNKGNVPRYISSADLVNGQLEFSNRIQFVSRDSAFGRTIGCGNIIEIQAGGENYVFSGPGAGRTATAQAVMSDLRYIIHTLNNPSLLGTFLSY